MTSSDLLKKSLQVALNVEPNDLLEFENEYKEMLESDEDDGIVLRATLDLVDKLAKALPDPEKLRKLADFFDKYDQATKYKPVPDETEVQDDLRNWANAAEEAMKI